MDYFESIWEFIRTIYIGDYTLSYREIGVIKK